MTGVIGPSRLSVAGAAPYDVVIGALDATRLTEELADMLASAADGGTAAPGPDGTRHRVARVALMYDAAPELADSVARVRSALEALGVRVLDLAHPGGELGKSAEAAFDAWEALGAAGFTRSDAVVTVGGGATTDLGGFVAATWLRGVPVIHLPTTLLAMVDAAIGGKTGINTGAGKNLVGSFHEPAGVICDLTTLQSLPRAEVISGLGEVIKCGFIADPSILDLIEATDPAALTWDSAALRDLVERSVRVKVDVVTRDLHERAELDQHGLDRHPGREVLNYGHTLAHAIERVQNYTIRHGEAVAIGCIYVAELAGLTCDLAPAVVARHHTVFGRVGLPTAYATGDFAALRSAMSVDKKARGSALRFVVLGDLARPRILSSPAEADLATAYARLSGKSQGEEGA
ncbi:MAG: 3-dehydroquinate synthase [Nocardioides sp.]